MPGRLGGRTPARDDGIDEIGPSFTIDGRGTLEGGSDFFRSGYLFAADLERVGDTDVVDVGIAEVAGHVFPHRLVLACDRREHMNTTTLRVIAAIVEDHDRDRYVVARRGPETLDLAEQKRTVANNRDDLAIRLCHLGSGRVSA